MDEVDTVVVVITTSTIVEIVVIIKIEAHFHLVDQTRIADLEEDL